MLKGDALRYYSKNVRNCTSSGQSLEKLKCWYNSDYEKFRILTTFQTMTLFKAMTEDPTDTEVNVFRNFFAKLSSLKNQLHPTYHNERFLRYRILTGVDIRSIRKTLRDRIPKTSLQTVNRVANQLDDKSNSSGSSPACAVSYDENGKSVSYSLGKKYGVETKRSIERPWTNSTNQENRSMNGIRLSPEWIRGIKGCSSAPGITGPP